MTKALIYVHGKGGNPGEAEHFRPMFPDHFVLGFDYQAQNPWDAREEFLAFFSSVKERFSSVSLLANSIGAWFSMQALMDFPLERAWFISPIVDMEALISQMCQWAGVTEDALQAAGSIETGFGETLSWEYLQWVRAHPIDWRVPTAILYGSNDNMQSINTIQTFSNRTGAQLTVMDSGEHWFHTPEQMAFLDSWIIRTTQEESTCLR